MTQCESTYRGVRCMHPSGHPADGNVWTDPLEVHHGGYHDWSDAASDRVPSVSGSDRG